MDTQLINQWRTCSQQLLSEQSPFALDKDVSGNKAFKNAPSNLIDAIQAGRRHGDAPFLLWQDQRLSFNQFFSIADTLTAALQQELKIRPGERVAIAMRNRP